MIDKVRRVNRKEWGQWPEGSEKGCQSNVYLYFIVIVITIPAHHYSIVQYNIRITNTAP